MMARVLHRRDTRLALLLLAVGIAVAACGGYASVGINGPYVGVGPFTVGTGVSIGLPL